MPTARRSPMPRSLPLPAVLGAAIALALAAAMLAVVPAQAASGWSNVKTNARHVKAQACRTGTYKNSQGISVKKVVYRVSAVGAKNGGSARLRALSDRFKPYTAGWVKVGKGKRSAGTSVHFLASETVKIRMRVKDGKGATRWSKAVPMTRLAWC